jgi:hypothetical protein
LKLVMAMGVRNEEDILEHNLRYHRTQGVDHFVVTDNGSTDSTPEILRRYQAEGILTLIEAPATGEFRDQQRLWVTRMARLAATELDADWVVHADADEFWSPVTGTLKQALSAIPAEYGVVLAPRPEFVARPDGSGPFWERMTIRETRSWVAPKVAHRADPRAVLPHGGAHEVDVERDEDLRRNPVRPVLRAEKPDLGTAEDRLVLAPEWPTRVLHFPLRSFDQYRRNVAVALREGPPYNDLRRAHEEDQLPELYSKLVYDDAAVEAGLRQGRLVEDLGVRDLLRRAPDPLAQDVSLPEPIAPAHEQVERELSEVRLDAMQTLTWQQRQLRRQLEDTFRQRRFKKLRKRLADAERALAESRDAIQAVVRRRR